MKKNVGPRLPRFTKVQSKVVKGALDFVGVNYYYSPYVNDRPLQKGLHDFTADMSIYMRGSKTDPPFGPSAPTSVASDLKGLQLLAQYLNEVYGGLPIYIQETGLATSNGSHLNGTDRIDYMKKHIGSTLTALRNGARVTAYFAWSFLDVFEFLAGFKSQYGLYRVDFDDAALSRQARLSARWYSKFLKNKGFMEMENEINDAGTRVQ